MLKSALLKQPPWFAVAVVLLNLTPMPAMANSIPVDIVATMGFSDVSVESVPVDRPEKAPLLFPEEDFDDANIAINLTGLGFDLYGLGEFRGFGNEDPFLGFEYRLTNVTNIGQGFFFRVTMPTASTGELVTSSVFMDWEVLDTSGDGFAVADFGQAAANLGTDKGIFSPFVEPPFDFNLFARAFRVTDTDGVTRVMEATNASADPASAEFMNSTSFEALEFQALASSLSAGDTVVIRGYACVADATQFCPADPDLQAVFAPVPIPAALWLFGSALGLLGWLKRRVV